MGEYTNNNHFYKPALGAKGATEKDLFDNALEDTDLIIEEVHANYISKNGIDNGQTLIGGTGTTDSLKLQGTSGAGDLTSIAIEFITGNNGSTSACKILNNGNHGIGITPTAALHLKAGTTTLAPLKLTSGAFLTVPEAGALEFVDDTLSFTITTGTARKNIAFINPDYSIGDLIYASSATTLDQIPDIATGHVLVSGGVDTAPLWGKVTDDHLDLLYIAANGRDGGQTLIGGTGVTDVLELQGTSSNGTLTSPAIKFLIGNAGTTTALTVLNNGNFGFNQAVFGTNAAQVIAIGSGTAPTTAPANACQLWVQDINGAAGYAGLHKITETTEQPEIIPGVIIKDSTGDPGNPYEALMCINTTDQTFNVYAGGAWRTLHTWAEA